MEKVSINKNVAAFLTLLAFVFLLDLASAARNQKINTAFIKASCEATTYPRLCFTSLSSHASTIRDDPKLLAQSALSVALDTARSTSDMMVKLSKTHGVKPREAGAMLDCVEELSDSVDQLGKSVGEMRHTKGSSEFALVMNDIETWVSAALTDDDTCTDGFAGKAMNGDLKNVVRGQIVNIAHLTSNALSLINSYAAIQ